MSITSSSSSSSSSWEDLGSVSDRERVNSRLKRLSGAEPGVFLGQVAVSVSAGARLDPESGQQNVRETVARARFHKIRQKLKVFCTF